MQLRVHSQEDELEGQNRRAIERKVRLVVGRFAAGVERVQVTLGRSDDESIRGPHRCRIHVVLEEGDTLTCFADDADPDDAVANAAWRVQRRLRQRPA